ncbi:MAG: efflux RND transporter permease subunit [Methylococcaceae bacterium]|nr:efflux RND transporter permease subunit [Methylococcaceae bacterium]
MPQSPQPDRTKSRTSGLIPWFAANPIAANLLMLLIWLGGIVGLWAINKETLPPIRTGVIDIIAAYPGAGPSEVERAVCVPLERAVFDLPGIKSLTGESTEEKCVLHASVQDGYALQDLISAIRSRTQTLPQLPRAVDRIEVREQNQGSFVINVVLYGPTDDLTLKRLGEGLREDLLRIPGVARLGDFTAEAPYEVAVQISAARLRQLQLSLAEVAERIRQTSLDVPGGVLKSPAGELLLRTHGKIEDGGTLASLPLLVGKDGTHVRLGEVATVSDGLAEQWAEARFQGQPAYGIEVYAGRDSVAVAERVKAYVAERSQHLPGGLRMETSWDASVSFAQRVDTLVEDGLSGFLLVFVVLVVFLRTRVAWWASLGILTSVLGTLWLMALLDISLNMLSLFGFLLAMGVLVDDAIIIGEAVHQEQTLGLSQESPARHLDAAVRGTQSVAQPVILAVLTTLVAFLPGLFLPGWAGQMMRPICLVMILTLALSLVEALLILPAHLAVAPTRRSAASRLDRLRSWMNRGLNRFVSRIYQPLLMRALVWRYLVLSGFGALLVLSAALVAGGHIRLSFEADATLDSVSARLTLPPGLPYHEMRALATRAEQALFSLRDELNRAQPPGSPSVVTNLETSIHPEWTGLWVEVAPHAREHLVIDDFVREWRKRIGDIGRAKIDFVYKQGDMPYDIEIDLNDADSSRLAQAVAEVKQRLAVYPGVYDVVDSSEAGKPEVRVRLKPEGERQGLTLKALAEQVRGAYFGDEAQRFVRGREEVKIMVRLPLEERRSLDALRALPVKLPSGVHAPLGSLAEVYFEAGQARIGRQDRRPVLKVQARVDSQKADVNAIYTDLERNHLPLLAQRFPQLHAEFGQERRDQQSAMSSLWRNAALSLVIIYALIAVPFRSYITPLVFLLAAPIAWCGAVLGHWLAGLPLSMESLVGMIAASGVVVNDSLVLLDYIQEKETSGEESGQANGSGPTSGLILEACTARFRPILLAFLTNFAGFLPTLLETSEQAQFLIPMTLSLSAGLLIGMAASLILTPVCYAILGRI